MDNRLCFRVSGTQKSASEGDIDRTECVPADYHFFFLRSSSFMYFVLQNVTTQNAFGMRAQKARGGYSHTLPIQVCAAQRGRERGTHFRGVF